MLNARVLIVPLLALQLAASVRLSEGVLLCVSAEGHTSIELALPGTARCADRDCEPADTAEHTCRDFVVLAGVADLAKGAATNIPVPPAVTAGVPLPHTDGAGIAACGLGVPPGARSDMTRQLRSVVLTV